MPKILFKKKIYDFERDCEDEFGKYHWYFRIHLCVSFKGINWQIETSDFFTNQKSLRKCLDDAFKHLELYMPRYYKLKDEVFKKGLHNQLW